MNVPKNIWFEWDCEYPAGWPNPWKAIGDYDSDVVIEDALGTLYILRRDSLPPFKVYEKDGSGN